MLSQTLFERKWAYADASIPKHLSMKGQFIRYFPSNFFKNVKKIYQFFSNGCFLAQFDNLPTHETIPSAVFYMCNFKEHIDVKIDNEEFTQINFKTLSIKIKFGDQNEKKTWTGMLSMFASKNIHEKRFAEAEDSEVIPAQVLLLIAEELEVENWSKIKQNFDYSMLLQDKGLKSLLNENKMLKNRLLIGKAFLKNKNNRTSLIGEIDFGKLPIVVQRKSKYKNLVSQEKSLIGSTVHLVLLSQKAIYGIDQETIRSENGVMDESNLPKGFDFDALYMYSYNKFGDKTDYVSLILSMLAKKRNY